MKLICLPFLLLLTLLSLWLNIGSAEASETSYNVYFSVANTTILKDSPTDIQIVDDKAYILSSYEVAVFNAADPAGLSLIADYTAFSGASAYAISGKYAYVAQGTRISIFDISTTPPKEKYYFTAQGGVVKMAVSNGLLFYVTRELGLFCYDLSYPENPVFKGSQITPSDANSLYISDRKVYITCSNAHLSIIDISEPSKLPVAGTYTFGSAFNDVYVQDDYAYLCQGSTGVQVLNIKKPPSPEWVTNIFSRKDSRQVVVSNYYAWMNDDNTIQAFYIKDKSYLYAGSYDNEGASINRIAVVNGKYIYVCSNDYRLKVLLIQYSY